MIQMTRTIEHQKCFWIYSNKSQDRFINTNLNLALITISYNIKTRIKENVQTKDKKLIG